MTVWQCDTHTRHSSHILTSGGPSKKDDSDDACGMDEKVQLTFKLVKDNLDSLVPAVDSWVRAAIIAIVYHCCEAFFESRNCSTVLHHPDSKLNWKVHIRLFWVHCSEIISKQITRPFIYICNVATHYVKICNTLRPGCFLGYLGGDWCLQYALIARALNQSEVWTSYKATMCENVTRHVCNCNYAK